MLCQDIPSVSIAPESEPEYASSLALLIVNVDLSAETSGKSAAVAIANLIVEDWLNHDRLRILKGTQYHHRTS